MKVAITDGLAEELDSQKTAATLDAEVEQRLTQTLHAPRGRVVLSLAELEQIADRLGTGLPIVNKGDLDRAIAQQAQIMLGNVRLQWTPSQLALIEEKAKKHGMRTDEFVAQVASKLLLEIFNVQPGVQGVFYTPGFDPSDDTRDLEPDEEPA